MRYEVLSFFCVMSLFGLATCDSPPSDPSVDEAIHRAVDTLAALGCQAEYPITSKSCVDCLGVLVRGSVQTLKLFDTINTVPRVQVSLHIADSVLDLSHGLTLPPNVLELDLENTRVIGVGALIADTSLKSLAFVKCPWDNDAILDVSKATELRVLTTDDTILRARQVKGAASLRSLRFLILDHEARDLIKSIPPLDDLCLLNLRGTHAEPRDVSRILSGAKDITFVYLGLTDVDDSILAVIANRQFLGEVEVSRTKVTSNGICKLIESSRIGHIVAVGIHVEDYVLDLAKRKGVRISGGSDQRPGQKSQD